jgi:very-short-patch-repair endonuclease
MATICPQRADKADWLSTRFNPFFRSEPMPTSLVAMSNQPDDFSEMLTGQANVVSHAQGVRAGLSGNVITGRVRGGRWQRLYRGVYATFSGDPVRDAQLWAALLRAGPGAVFSHQTAAEIYGFLRQPSPVVHITVPADRHPARRSKIPGVVIHRSSKLWRTRHPTMSMPCTRVEDTVLDLIEASASFDEAYDWICRAIGRGRTTAGRIRKALDARPKFPNRRDTELALGDASEGALSWLELRYVRGVERIHGIQAAKRQARVRQETGNKYLDNLYEDFRVCVELDGTTAHPRDEQWRDTRRDRWNLVYGKMVTMRLGYLDLRDQQSRCETAAEVATVLSDHGPAVGHSCGSYRCQARFAKIMGR